MCIVFIRLCTPVHVQKREHTVGSYTYAYTVDEDSAKYERFTRVLRSVAMFLVRE